MIIQAENQLKKAIASHLGIEDYIVLVNDVNKTNISEDTEYQHTFNRFYVVRHNIDWRIGYYRFFESKKKDNPSFGDIIQGLKEENLGIQPSFSSKMLATIDPQYPIWDSHVLDKLELTDRWKRDKSVANAIEIYDDICKWFRGYLESPNAKENIRIFDSMVPKHKSIADVKKIDYLLWIK